MIPYLADRVLNQEPELSRNLATMSQQHSETVSNQNSEDHASRIVELDTQKFRIAKAASDLEIEGERLEQELKGLKQDLHELDEQGIEGDELTRAKREGDDPTMSVDSFLTKRSPCHSADQIDPQTQAQGISLAWYRH